MENYIEKQHLERRNRFLGFILTIIITTILLFIEIWYFIIIPGIVAGALNRNTRKSMKIGAVGVSLVWSIYILIAIFTKNSYTYVDQFAGLIFGDLGYGWILIIVIILIGALFGALGGALGSLGAMMIALHNERKESTIVENNQ